MYPLKNNPTVTPNQIQSKPNPNIEEQILTLYKAFSESIATPGNKDPNDIDIKSLNDSFNLYTQNKPFGDTFVNKICSEISQNIDFLSASNRLVKRMQATTAERWMKNPTFNNAQEAHNQFIAEPTIVKGLSKLKSNATDDVIIGFDLPSVTPTANHEAVPKTQERISSTSNQNHGFYSSEAANKRETREHAFKQDMSSLQSSKHS